MQLGQKINEKQAYKIKNTLFEFNFALINKDLKLIASYLDDKGIYFGQNKAGFLGTLVSFFHGLPDSHKLFPVIYKGISLEHFAGCDVYEIRFLTLEEENHCSIYDDELGIENRLGKPVEHNEKCFRYCAGFKDGNLFRLYYPKKFILFEDLKEHIKNN
jgi:hypothetical protein